MSRRAVLRGAVVVLPAMLSEGCQPWRIVWQAPQNPLVHTRSFALTRIVSDPTDVTLSDYEFDVMAAAIRQRMAAGRRGYDSPPPFHVETLQASPSAAFVLLMNITVQSLGSGSGEASMVLTIAELDRTSTYGEGAIVDQVEIDAGSNRRGVGLIGLLAAAATPRADTMRELGYALANRALSYLLTRTTAA